MGNIVHVSVPGFVDDWEVDKKRVSVMVMSWVKVAFVLTPV